jgi:hypothetical protein
MAVRPQRDESDDSAQLCLLGLGSRYFKLKSGGWYKLVKDSLIKMQVRTVI